MTSVAGDSTVHTAGDDASRMTGATSNRDQLLMASQQGSTAMGSGSAASHQTTTISTSDNLNDRLNTQYLDLDPDDNSCMASITRMIADSVGYCCTPHRMLVTMRLLKAVTFSFLVLTIAADGMYIWFVDFMSEYGDDGWRGTIIRFYGLGLSIMAIMLELDVQKMVYYFLGLKGFIPRSLLLFLVAVITNASPMHNPGGSASSSGGGRRLGNNNNNNNGGYDDGYYNANDDNNNGGGGNDDNNNGGQNAYYASNDDNANYMVDDFADDGGGGGASASSYNGAAAMGGSDLSDVPVSAIAFQMVTSWVLACCALCYFVLGLFCCDRFTSKAFMSTRDPVASTIIDDKRGSPDRSYAVSEASASYVKA